MNDMTTISSTAHIYRLVKQAWSFDYTQIEIVELFVLLMFFNGLFEDADYIDKNNLQPHILFSIGCRFQIFGCIL